MGCGCDLEVDTDQLRVAANLLQRAAGAAEVDGPPASSNVAEHAAGGSAAGREALRLVRARTVQASLASRTLSQSAARLADLLRRVAADFDTAEELCRAGG
jgi:hypothetical protein